MDKSTLDSNLAALDRLIQGTSDRFGGRDRFSEDYMMRLTLLEQQNKERLRLARQQQGHASVLPRSPRHQSTVNKPDEYQTAQAAQQRQSDQTGRPPSDDLHREMADLDLSRP